MRIRDESRRPGSRVREGPLKFLSDWPMPGLQPEWPNPSGPSAPVKMAPGEVLRHARYGGSERDEWNRR